MKLSESDRREENIVKQLEITVYAASDKQFNCVKIEMGYLTSTAARVSYLCSICIVRLLS